MLFMIVNRTRPNVTPAQYRELAALAKRFYAEVPDGVRLLNDWAAPDGSRTFRW
jgi:hypothetical protein